MPSTAHRASARTKRVPKKWIHGVADEAAVRSGCWFDEAAGDRVVEFFEKFLCHSKGRQWAGKPFILQAWQRDRVIKPLFGWKRPDGTRRFRKAWLEMGKKNGKSTLASGVALYLLVADGEPGAEVYSAATARDQAAIVFREAANMVEASPALLARTMVTRSRNNIAFPETSSFYRAVSAEAGVNEGLNIHGLIFDEMHALKDRAFWNALEYGGTARQQPLLFVITTAGWDRTTIGWELHEYALQVVAGAIQNDTFFAYIRGADEEDEWTSPKTWRKANPSMGVIFTKQSLATDCKEAQARPAQENQFRRYRLSQWTENVSKWLPPEHWKACGHDVEDAVAWRKATLQALKGEQCFGGLDLGSTSDLTALALLFPREDEPWILLPWFWVPEQGAWRKDAQRRSVYEAWMRQGFVTPTEGNVADYDTIRQQISGCPPVGTESEGLADDFGIADLAVDRLFQGAQLCTQLMGDGMNVIAFGQGFYSMAAPTKEFEERVLNHSLAHGNNPVLNWMAANVSVLTDPAGNIKPTKPDNKSSFKIDGIVAGIMALGRAMARETKTGSVYDERGLLTVGGSNDEEEATT